MKIKLFFSAIICLCAIHTFSQNYITVYADCNYRGESQQLTVGSYNLNTTRIGKQNLSSMRIPSGLKVVLYAAADPGTGNEKITFDSDISCLSNSGWNDKAGSLVIEAVNYYGKQVTLYTDCNYGGTSQAFGNGRYNFNDLASIGNDQLSSLTIPDGWTVTVYTDADYRGASETYSSNISCLSIYFNDMVSSMWIRRNNYNNNGNNNNNNNGDLPKAYSDCYFRGTSQSFYAGRFNASELATKIGNDAISSIQLPQGWSVTVYDDANFTGRNQTFTGDLNCLGSDWNDKISSLSFSNRNNNNNNNYNNNNNPVVLYSDCNLRGNSQSFSSGSFNTYQLGSIGNDQLSSIKIPNGWAVTIYDDANYKGRSQTYYSDVYCLPEDWNDKVSSITIRRN